MQIRFGLRFSLEKMSTEDVPEIPAAKAFVKSANFDNNSKSLLNNWATFAGHQTFIRSGHTANKRVLENGQWL